MTTSIANPEAIADREAANKAAAETLRPIIAALKKAMATEDKPKALRAAVAKMQAPQHASRAEAITLAANRIERDPLDFDAVRIVKIAIDGLTEAADMLSSCNSMTADTPGAIQAPAPARPDDYHRTTQRMAADYEVWKRQQDALLHPTARIR